MSGASSPSSASSSISSAAKRTRLEVDGKKCQYTRQKSHSASVPGNAGLLVLRFSDREVAEDLPDVLKQMRKRQRSGCHPDELPTLRSKPSPQRGYGWGREAAASARFCRTRKTDRYGPGTAITTDAKAKCHAPAPSSVFLFTALPHRKQNFTCAPSAYAALVAQRSSSCRNRADAAKRCDAWRHAFRRDGVVHSELGEASATNWRRVRDGWCSRRRGRLGAVCAAENVAYHPDEEHDAVTSSRRRSSAVIPRARPGRRMMRRNHACGGRQRDAGHRDVTRRTRRSEKLELPRHHGTPRAHLEQAEHGGRAAALHAARKRNRQADDVVMIDLPPVQIVDMRGNEGPLTSIFSRPSSARWPRAERRELRYCS